MAQSCQSCMESGWVGVGAEHSNQEGAAVSHTLEGREGGCRRGRGDNLRLQWGRDAVLSPPPEGPGSLGAGEGRSQALSQSKVGGVGKGPEDGHS